MAESFAVAHGQSASRRIEPTALSRGTIRSSGCAGTEADRESLDRGRLVRAVNHSPSVEPKST